MNIKLSGKGLSNTNSFPQKVTRHSGKVRDLIVFLGFMAVSFVLFSNGIRSEFVFDDHSVIENRETLKGFNILRIFLEPWHPGSESNGNYRPLTLASFSLNLMFSDNPAGSHILST